MQHEDECPSAIFRERGFAVSEDVSDDHPSELMVGDEVTFDEQVHKEEYTEGVEEEYAAMITVEYDNNDTDLDVSEFVAMSKEAHTIHLDSCCTRHMTGFYNLSQPTACVRTSWVL